MAPINDAAAEPSALIMKAPAPKILGGKHCPLPPRAEANPAKAMAKVESKKPKAAAVAVPANPATGTNAKGTPDDEAAKLEAKKLAKKLAAVEKEGGNEGC